MSTTMEHTIMPSPEDSLSLLLSEKQHLFDMLKSLAREKRGSELLQQFLDSQHECEADTMSFQLQSQSEHIEMLKRDNEMLQSCIDAQKAEIHCVTNQRDGVITRYKELYQQHRTLSTDMMEVSDARDKLNREFKAYRKSCSMEEMKHLKEEVASATKLITMFEEEDRANKRRIAKLESMLQKSRKGIKTSLQLDMTSADSAISSSLDLHQEATTFQQRAKALSGKMSKTRSRTSQKKSNNKKEGLEDDIKGSKKRKTAVSVDRTVAGTKKMKENSEAAKNQAESKSCGAALAKDSTVTEEDDDELFDKIISQSKQSLHSVMSPALAPEVSSKPVPESVKSHKAGSGRLFNTPHVVSDRSLSSSNKTQRQPLRSMTTFSKGGVGADLFSQYLRGGGRTLKIPKLKSAGNK